jgi:hypothetical protein
MLKSRATWRRMRGDVFVNRVERGKFHISQRRSRCGFVWRETGFIGNLRIFEPRKFFELCLLDDKVDNGFVEHVERAFRITFSKRERF